MRELSAGQHSALTFGAISASLAVACGGKSLLWAVAALALAGLIYRGVRGWLPEGKSLAACMPAWLLIPELLFLILAAAKTASYATLCWPGGGSWPLFPLTLLVLGAASTWQGTDGVGRCASVLVWACVLFYGVVLGAAALETERRFEVGTWRDGIPIGTTALAAVCSLFLPAKKGGKALWPGLIAFSLLMLWSTLEKGGELPLITAVKGISLFGILQRFEAMASCVMTVGMFLMLSLLSAAGGEIMNQFGVSRGGAAVTVPAAVLLFWTDRIPDVIYTVGAAVLWGLIPLLNGLLLPAEKTLKKMKKELDK